MALPLGQADHRGEGSLGCVCPARPRPPCLSVCPTGLLHLLVTPPTGTTHVSCLSAQVLHAEVRQPGAWSHAGLDREVSEASRPGGAAPPLHPWFREPFLCQLSGEGCVGRVVPVLSLGFGSGWGQAKRTMPPTLSHRTCTSRLLSECGPGRAQCLPHLLQLPRTFGSWGLPLSLGHRVCLWV